MLLQGKRAIITGANRSIGRAIALRFAEEGADVVISYRSQKETAEKVVQEIEKRGGKALALHADFSQEENISFFMHQAIDFLGGIDILVNNAGAYNTASLFELKYQDFEHTLRITTLAPFWLSRLAAEEMRQQQTKGSIINISTISSLQAYPSRIAHASAKAALNMLTKNLALELAPYQIRVNAVAPGSTPYEEELSADHPIDSPLGRVGTPEDQARVALFLASDESSFITGEIITVDGGQTLL